MIIGVTGYGATGASACMDLIKEFEDVQFCNPHLEFQLLQQPDGIEDLRYHLTKSRRRISVNAAIVRFLRRCHLHEKDKINVLTHQQYGKLSEEYVNSLVQVTWQGKSSVDPEDLRSRFEKKKYRYLRGGIDRVLGKVKPEAVWPPYRTRYFTAVSEEEFVAATREYLDRLFAASGFDTSRPIMLEQLFCLEDPTEGGDYFDDFRSIIVDRDPRDVYVMTNGYFSGRVTSFMPNSGDVQAFIDYFRGLHHSKSSDPRVYYLQYEDLIYRYEETARSIAGFIGLTHTSPKERFKPEWSINNTKTWLKYPEFEKDIRAIEEQLPDLLYPFEEREAHLDFVPENTGVFDAKPGDKKDLLYRSEKLRKSRKKKQQ